MREDLIKRSDAIEAVMNTEPVFAVDSLEPYQKTKDVVEAIESVPSADRPQGEWIFTNNPLRLDDEWACSRCGNISFVRTNFCDRCGARMKGADDDNAEAEG